MAKGSKIGWLSALAFIGGLGLFAVGAASYLGTPAGSDFLLAHLKKALKDDAGATLQYARGSINPFSGVHFEGLKLDRDEGGKSLHVAIASVDIHFAISLLARHVDIDRFEIKQPSIVSKTALAQTPVTRIPGDSSAAPDLAAAQKWISQPPFQVTLRKLSVEGLNLDLDQRTPEAALSARIRGLNAHATLTWLRESFKVSGDLDLGKAGPWSLVSVPAGGGAKSKLDAQSLGGSAQWSLAVDRKGSVWNYEFSDSQAELALHGLSWSSQGTAGEARASLPEVHFSAVSKLVAKSSELFTLDPGSLKIADTRATVSVGSLVFEKALPGAAPLRLTGGAQEFKLLSGLKDVFEFTLAFEGKSLASPTYLTHPTSLSADSMIGLTQDLKSATVQSHLSLGGIRFVDSKLDAKVGAAGQNAFSAHGKLTAILSAALAHVLKPAAAIKTIGPIDSELGFETQASGSFATLFAAVQGLGKAPLKSRVELLVRPIRFEPVSFTADISRDPDKNQIQAQLKGQAPSVLAPPLKKACSLALTSDLLWDGTQEVLTADGAVQVQKEEALTLKSRTTLKSGSFESESTLDFKVSDYLEGLFSAQSLKGYGKWQLHAQQQFTQDGKGLRENGTVVVSQVSAPGALSVSLPEPFKITHRLNRDSKQTDGEISGDLPLLEAARYGKVVATHFSATARTPQATLGKDLDLKLELKQGDVELSEALAKKAPKLAGLEVSLQGQLRAGNELEVQSFSAGLGHGMLKLTGDGSGKLKTRDFESRGILSLRIPDDFPKVDGAALHGVVEVPWNLSLVQGREIDIDGTAFLEKLSASTAQGGLSGVTGSIPLSEKLVWDGKHLRFASLINQNPFERVDFERVRPLIQGANQVRFEELRWEEKTYGPLVAYFSLRQNMLQAQQVDMSIGAGKINGQLFFNAHPATLQFGMLTRITGLDLAQVLPKKFLLRVPGGDKTVSGRSGIVVDLNKRSIDGRIDITEIGSTQLKMMINVLDPEFKDEKMNQLRSRLDLGYPRYVQMALAQGYMNMKVGLVVLDASWEESFPGLSVSPWIAPAAAEIVKKTQEGPLK